MTSARGRMGFGLALAACGSCSHVAPAEAEGATSVPAAAAPEPDWRVCDAGGLPRFTRADLADADLAALSATSSARPIAVVWTPGEAAKSIRVVADCVLPGSAYVGFPGEDGRGVFWSADRMIFRSDEVVGACRRATHVVAAFATPTFVKNLETPVLRAVPASLQGVLVPLPCPPVSDPMAAPGCVGQGATGPERVGRARPLWEALSRDDVYGLKNIEPAFQMYALVPDHFWGVTIRHWIRRDPYAAQLKWLESNYEIGKVSLRPPLIKNEFMDDYDALPTVDAAPVKLREASKRSAPPSLRWIPTMGDVDVEPPFLRCFPAVVDPHVRLRAIF